MEEQIKTRARDRRGWGEESKKRNQHDEIKGNLLLHWKEEYTVEKGKFEGNLLFKWFDFRKREGECT